MGQSQSPLAPRPRGFLSSQIRMLLATLAIAVVLGAAALPWLLSSPARISRLIAGAVPELQGDVRIGTVRLGWTGPLVLENIAVVPRVGGEPPIRIRRIEASHGLAQILLSAGDVGRLRIEGLEADVVYDANRKSNFEGLFMPAPADATGSAAPRARRSPVRLRLEVADAIVRIDGPWTQEPWVSDPINVRASLGPSADGAWSEWVIEPVQLLADARMEPGVAQGVLAYIAPVLADATRTSGRFSLRLDGARLPVGQPAGGTIAGVLAMHEVVLGPGPLVTRLIESLPMQLPTPPAIRIADESHVSFRVADGRVWHEGLEFGVPLAKPGQRLDVHSSGSVGIEDKSLDVKLALPIPADLPQDRPLLAALAGKSVSIGIGGFLGQPKVNFDGSIKATAGDVVADLLGRIRNGAPPPDPVSVPAPMPPAAASGNSPPPPGWKPGEPGAAPQASGTAAAAGDPTAEAIVDLVGGVLDEVAKRRAERRAAEAANPDQVPPRRGRLLRRLVPPPAPEATPAPPPAPGP